MQLGAGMKEMCVAKEVRGGSRGLEETSWFEKKMSSTLVVVKALSWPVLCSGSSATARVRKRAARDDT